MMETSFVLSKERPSGCAGLFSNAPDLLTFLEMLLNEGTYRGIRYFTPETVREMHTNQLSLPDISMGLGWELNKQQFMGKYAKPNMFGKTGFTGTVCVVDPERGIAFVMPSNRTFPERTSADALNEARQEIFSDIVFAS